MRYFTNVPRGERLMKPKKGPGHFGDFINESGGVKGKARLKKQRVPQEAIGISLAITGILGARSYVVHRRDQRAILKLEKEIDRLEAERALLLESSESAASRAAEVKERVVSLEKKRDELRTKRKAG